MLQKIDKKKYIFLYLIIFLVLSSIHNSNLKHKNFFIVKKIEVVGLDKTDNLLLEKKLKDLVGSNIFTINKETFKFIKSENLINRYNVKKNISKSYKSLPRISCGYRCYKIFR